MITKHKIIKFLFILIILILVIFYFNPDNKTTISNQFNNENKIKYDLPNVLSNDGLINITKIDLPDNQFASIAGFFLKIDNDLFLFDRLGNFFSVKNDNVSKIKIPDIPNNLNSYLNDNLSYNNMYMRVQSAAYYKNNRSLYLSYVRYIDKSCKKFVISKIIFDKDSLSFNRGWTDIFLSQCIDINRASHEGGGKILIHNDNLYFTIGYPDSIGLGEDENFTSDHIYNSQDINSQFGKVFLLDLNNNVLELLSIGHRNPQGLIFIADADKLLETEHGPQGGDEINLIIKNKNYGWPFETYGNRYGKNNYDLPVRTPSNLMIEKPLYAFVPSIGISAIVKSETFHKKWMNDLLVAGMSSKSIHRLKFDKDFQRVIFQEQIKLEARIRDIIESNGSIYTLTDHNFLLKLNYD